MLRSKFYWGTVRKAIVAFGSLFTDVYVDRCDENTGEVVQTIKVPLLYSPRQKSIATIEATPESYTQEFQTVVPRMGFEIQSITYDPARQTAATGYTFTKRDNRTTNRLYSPSPYNIRISLSVYTRNQEDGWQIIEQIIPFFTPDYNVNKNSMPELNLEEDIPITLLNIDFTDLYGNTYAERRMIIWDITFEMKLNFFGPIQKGNIISRVFAHLKDMDTKANIADYDAQVVPPDANKNDPHVIKEYWRENYGQVIIKSDSYDPITATDEIELEFIPSPYIIIP